MIFKKGEKVQHNDCCTKVAIMATEYFFYEKENPKNKPQNKQKTPAEYCTILHIKKHLKNALKTP